MQRFVCAYRDVQRVGAARHEGGNDEGTEGTREHAVRSACPSWHLGLGRPEHRTPSVRHPGHPQQRRTIPEVAREFRTDPRPLYRRFDRILLELRERLGAQGITEAPISAE
jgi:hypothetical protein